MAKLISILAASVGGGLVLGASIRLGEAIGSSIRPAQGQAGEPALPAGARSAAARADVLLNRRLDRLEERLSQAPLHPGPAPTPAGPQPAPEWQSALAGVVARMDRQQKEVEAIRHQAKGATQAVDSVGEIAAHLRDEIQRQLREDLDQRLAAVEEKLQLSVEAARGEAVGAMLASIEARVAPRIDRLESDIVNQSAALAELRDCSLQSERSIQRLLGVLDRVMSPKAVPAEPGGNDAPKLSVVASRGQEETAAEGSGARRPASLR